MAGGVQRRGEVRELEGEGNGRSRTRRGCRGAEEERCAKGADEEQRRLVYICSQTGSCAASPTSGEEGARAMTVKPPGTGAMLIRGQILCR